MAKTVPVNPAEKFTHNVFMRRCIELARKGAGNVAPNPMVGALLVHEGQIIGEGFHEKYGESHAEPNCIRQAVKSGFEDKLKQSTLYVSLEPCAHFGKTPPCADLIIQYGIPKVVIGSRDPFPEVNGKGIEKLKSTGVEIEVGIEEEACQELNKRFFVFHRLHRPYITLKWAETADKFIAPLPQNGITRLQISNEYSNRLVHQWRSEEAAIMIGSGTAISDNPALTTRLWPGNSPVRLAIDLDLKLPQDLQIFDQTVQTIVFNLKIHQEKENLIFYQLYKDASIVHQIVNALYQLKIQSVLIEGGARLLQSFIDEGIWDEARIIRNTSMQIAQGLPSPVLTNGVKNSVQTLETDTIEKYYRNEQ